MWTSDHPCETKDRGAQQQLRMAKLHYAAQTASLPVDFSVQHFQILAVIQKLNCSTSRSHLFVLSAAGCDASVSAVGDLQINHHHHRCQIFIHSLGIWQSK